MSYNFVNFLVHLPCLDPETGQFDHDGKYISDWGGDPGVIGGTFDCSGWECQRCRETYDAPPPSDSYEDYPFDY